MLRVALGDGVGAGAGLRARCDHAGERLLLEIAGEILAGEGDVVGPGAQPNDVGPGLAGAECEESGVASGVHRAGVELLPSARRDQRDVGNPRAGDGIRAGAERPVQHRSLHGRARANEG